jgi:hypothetical protein
MALTWMATTLPGARYYEVQYSTDRNTWTVYTRERDISWGGWINHHGSVQFGPYLYALPTGQGYSYRVRVLDASQAAISGWSNVLSGTVARWNQAPTIDVIPTATVRAGELLVVDVRATDPEQRRVEIRSATLPNGSGFYRPDRGDGPVEGVGSAHGEFIWGPEDVDTGTHFVWFTARDEFGGESQALLQIVVCERNGNVCGFF